MGHGADHCREHDIPEPCVHCQEQDIREQDDHIAGLARQMSNAEENWDHLNRMIDQLATEAGWSDEDSADTSLQYIRACVRRAVAEGAGLAEVIDRQVCEIERLRNENKDIRAAAGKGAAQLAIKLGEAGIENARLTKALELGCGLDAKRAFSVERDTLRAENKRLRQESLTFYDSLDEHVAMRVQFESVTAWAMSNNSQCKTDSANYGYQLARQAVRDLLAEHDTRTAVNQCGCMPDEDVCMEHHEPLECPHGCSEAKPHRCAAHQEENDG